MSEAKQNPEKELIEYFVKNKDTDIMSSNGQLTEESSSYLSNKTKHYIQAMFINSRGNDLANAIEIENQKYLSEPEKNIDAEKKIPDTDMLHALLQNPFVNKQTNNFLKFEERKKTRLLVKRGVFHISLLLNDVALIYTKGKLVYVIDSNTKKYSLDKTLSELEEELDHSIFFRANRQYIINIDFIKSFKAYRKVKLIVDINITELEYRVCISQHVAPTFKKWMNDA